MSNLFKICVVPEDIDTPATFFDHRIYNEMAEKTRGFIKGGVMSYPCHSGYSTLNQIITYSVSTAMRRFEIALVRDENAYVPDDIEFTIFVKFRKQKNANILRFIIPCNPTHSNEFFAELSKILDQVHSSAILEFEEKHGERQW